MDKQDNLQLELFSQSNGPGEIKNRASDNRILASVWKYEKTILIIIGIVITGIISFSLGVEKGKSRSVQLPVKKNIEKEINAAEQRTINKDQTSNEPEPPEKQDYIIQLASYKTKAYAQKEAEALKKKGLSPLVLSKGNYVVLCIGNFSNRQTAQSLLSELKKRYKDCYIRRL